MKKLSLESLRAIERGVAPELSIKIYFQDPEIYTKNDYLESAGPLSEGMSSEGAYSIANASVVLRNKNYYFSRKFGKELPVKRLVEISGMVGTDIILLFRGIIGRWRLTEALVTLEFNA